MRDVFSLDKPIVESHAAMCASFDWHVPKTFNFATDVIGGACIGAATAGLMALIIDGVAALWWRWGT